MRLSPQPAVDSGDVVDSLGRDCVADGGDDGVLGAAAGDPPVAAAIRGGCWERGDDDHESRERLGCCDLHLRCATLVETRMMSVEDAR